MVSRTEKMGKRTTLRIWNGSGKNAHVPHGNRKHQRYLAVPKGKRSDLRIKKRFFVLKDTVHWEQSISVTFPSKLQRIINDKAQKKKDIFYRDALFFLCFIFVKK